MTDDIQTLLRQHMATESFDPIDPSVVERAGARALRRRTRARLVVGAVGLLVLGSATAAGLLRGSDHTTAPAGSPIPARVSWADGTVIHDGPSKVDVGRTVLRYVRTSVGFVFTDDAGGVWSWKNGTATRVGHTYGPLFAAPSGPLAGWVDQGRPQSPVSFVVLNQDDGQVLTRTGHSSSVGIMAPGEYVGADFYGLDGNTAWWLDGDAYYRTTLTWSRHNVASGSTTARRLHLPPGRRLLAASARVLVEQDRSGDVAAVHGGVDVDLAGVAGGTALLAPDSDHVAFATDEGRATAQIYDTATGQQVRLEPTAWSALVTQWLTDRTVAVLVAAHEGDHYRLETCSVQTAHCTIAVPDLGSGPRTGQGNGLSFRLPTGDYWFPYPHG